MRGSNQRKDRDYFDKHSPVIKVATIRALIALASLHGLLVHQMDMQVTFLNGYLEEDLYKRQPEGMIVLKQEHKVCKLVKISILSKTSTKAVV